MKPPQSKSTKLDEILDRFDEGLADNEPNCWLELKENLEAYVESKVLEGRRDEVETWLEWIKHNYISRNPKLFGWGDKIKYGYIKERLAELEATPEGRSEK